MKVHLFITGRMYHLADEAPESLSLEADATLAAALAALQAQLPAELPASTLVSVAGRHCGSVGKFEDRSLRDGDELMLVVPVAGG